METFLYKILFLNQITLFLPMCKVSHNPVTFMKTENTSKFIYMVTVCHFKGMLHPSFAQIYFLTMFMVCTLRKMENLYKSSKIDIDMFKQFSPTEIFRIIEISVFTCSPLKTEFCELIHFFDKYAL